MNGCKPNNPFFLQVISTNVRIQQNTGLIFGSVQHFYLSSSVFLKSILLPFFKKTMSLLMITLYLQGLPQRAIYDIQTFNTLYSASSPVITSIFFSKHFGDDLEERAAADSIRDIFLIVSVPKRK